MKIPHFFNEPTGYITSIGLGFCLGSYLPDGFKWAELFIGMALIISSTMLFLSFHIGHRTALRSNKMNNPDIK